MEIILDNTPNLKLVEPHEVRWLSLQHAVTTLFRIWNAVIMALESDAAALAGNGQAQAKAKGILDKAVSFQRA